MKIWFLALATVMVPALSQALVTDKLNCSLQIKHVETGSVFKQSGEGYFARLPMSMSPAPDRRMTGASVKQALSTMIDGYKLDLEVGRKYRHAMKVDASGGVVQAVQTNCTTMNLSLTGSHTSAAAASICVETPADADPFDAKWGWDPVDVINGIPGFSQRDWNAGIQIVTEDATFVVDTSCWYGGTYL